MAGAVAGERAATGGGKWRGGAGVWQEERTRCGLWWRDAITEGGERKSGIILFVVVVIIIIMAVVVVVVNINIIIKNNE